MSLSKLFFNKITPYHRSFIHIVTEKETKIMLPAINSAVFFLTNGDAVTIDSFDTMDKLPYIDYQYLESNEELKLDMQEFKTYIKSKLYSDNFADFQVINKQIIGNSIYILLKETKLER